MQGPETRMQIAQRGTARSVDEAIRETGRFMCEPMPIEWVFLVTSTLFMVCSAGLLEPRGARRRPRCFAEVRACLFEGL